MPKKYKSISDLEKFIKKVHEYQKKVDINEWKKFPNKKFKKPVKKETKTKQELREEIRKLKNKLKSEKAAKTKLANTMGKEIIKLEKKNKELEKRIKKLNKFNRFDILDLEDN